MRLSFALLSLLAFGIACAAGKKDPSSDDEETDVPGGSDACDAYLDCVNDVDPSSYADAADAYGENGSCWASSGDSDGCSEACDGARADLAEENPLSDDCGGAGYPDVTGCPFVEGEWLITFDADDNECGFPNPFGARGLVSCRDESRGTFDWELDDLFTGGSCASDGLSFECEADYGDGTMAWTGVFDDWQDAGAGDWLYTFASCTSSGTFEASLED